MIVSTGTPSSSMPKEIVGAQIEQVEAQLALVEEQLSRARLIAPFDGYVVTGDLSQNLGSPVARGDVLFEVGQLPLQIGLLGLQPEDAIELGGEVREPQRVVVKDGDIAAGLVGRDQLCKGFREKFVEEKSECIREDRQFEFFAQLGQR